jgi:hypothetical protein
MVTSSSMAGGSGLPPTRTYFPLIAIRLDLLLRSRRLRQRDGQHAVLERRRDLVLPDLVNRYDSSNRPYAALFSGRSLSPRVVKGPNPLPLSRGMKSFRTRNPEPLQKIRVKQNISEGQKIMPFLVYFAVTGPALLLALLLISARLDPANATRPTEFFGISPAKAGHMDSAQRGDQETPLFQRLKLKSLR